MSRSKGSIVLKIVKALRAQREAALRVLPPHLHHYLDAQLLPGSWYDDRDFAGLLEALASLTKSPIPGVDVYEYMGRYSAIVDFEGIYKSLVRKGDPGSTLRSLENLYRVHHDANVAKVTLEGNGSATVDVDDRDYFTDIFCRTIAGTIWAALDQGGATQIEVRKTSCQGKGDDVCSWKVRWEGARIEK